MAASAWAQPTDIRLAPGRESEVRQAIVDGVKNRMGGDVDVRVEVIRFGTAAGAGEGTLVATPEPGARLARAIRFSLARRPSGAGRTIPAGYALATIFVDAPHARATRAIARGETCQASDVVAGRGDVGAVPLQRLPNADEVVGTRAVRGLAADEIITRSLVAVQSTVKSGDVVVLGAAVEGVRVETQGVATQSGGAGETIRVVNRESRRTVRARVVAPGRVEVVQ